MSEFAENRVDFCGLEMSCGFHVCKLAQRVFPGSVTFFDHSYFLRPLCSTFNAQHLEDSTDPLDFCGIVMELLSAPCRHRVFPETPTFKILMTLKLTQPSSSRRLCFFLLVSVHHAAALSF